MCNVQQMMIPSYLLCLFFDLGSSLRIFGLGAALGGLEDLVLLSLHLPSVTQPVD